MPGFSVRLPRLDQTLAPSGRRSGSATTRSARSRDRRASDTVTDLLNAQRAHYFLLDTKHKFAKLGRCREQLHITVSPKMVILRVDKWRLDGL